MTLKNVDDELHEIERAISSLMTRSSPQLRHHLESLFDVLLQFYALVEQALDPSPDKDVSDDGSSPPRLFP